MIFLLLIPWGVSQLRGGVVDGDGTTPGHVDEVGRVVEGPVEGEVRRVSDDPANDVNHLALSDPMNDGLLVLTNGDIWKNIVRV